MSLILEEHTKQIKGRFEKLENPVRILMFTQELECQYCIQTRQLLSEVVALSDKLSLEVYDLLADAKKAEEYGVNKVPAIAIVGKKDYGVRFYGLPYGYELQTLLEGVLTVSSARTDLSEVTKTNISEVKAPVHIQVFVTMTCPYCPIVAGLAYKFAVESDVIRVDVIEVSEFPYLAVKYGVAGVPKTVINEKVEFVGVLPEDLFLEHVILAAA